MPCASSSVLLQPCSYAVLRKRLANRSAVGDATLLAPWWHLLWVPTQAHQVVLKPALLTARRQNRVKRTAMACICARETGPVPTVLGV